MKEAKFLAKFSRLHHINFIISHTIVYFAQILPIRQNTTLQLQNLRGKKIAEWPNYYIMAIGFKNGQVATLQYVETYFPNSCEIGLKKKTLKFSSMN